MIRIFRKKVRLSHGFRKTVKKKKLSLDEVYESMQQEGLFGILSGTNYSCEEIFPTYYQRQAAEQMFCEDFGDSFN